jgi:hypothetical protein
VLTAIKNFKHNKSQTLIVFIAYDL